MTNLTPRKYWYGTVTSIVFLTGALLWSSSCSQNAIKEDTAAIEPSRAPSGIGSFQEHVTSCEDANGNAESYYRASSRPVDTNNFTQFLDFYGARFEEAVQDCLREMKDLNPIRLWKDPLLTNLLNAACDNAKSNSEQRTKTAQNLVSKGDKLDTPLKERRDYLDQTIQIAQSIRETCEKNLPK
jgi:hypothetical protein